jgi:hypothetical protein
MITSFTGETRAGERPLPARIDTLVIAGWTGRDGAAVEAHIAELERLGVKRPASVPIFYRVAASLLTTEPMIEVAGSDTSGEVEPVILSLGNGLWVGVGSDHTDRKAETIGITLAKQVCAKPVSARLWPYAEVADHWDELILRSYATRSGRRSLYQEGRTAALRPPPELITKYMNLQGNLPAGTAMFGGTLAVHGAIEGADRLELELEDPVLGRVLTHSYTVRILPVAG